MSAILLEIVGLCVGAPLGLRLARRGVTAETALKGRGLPAAILVVLAATVAALFHFRQRLPWIPPMPLLYAEAWLTPAIQLLAGFALGLVLFLEWPGRRDPKRLRSLLLGSIAFGVCLAYLVWQSLPLANRLGPAEVQDGVVLQTTSYTCAPSSIATLVRYVLGDTTATERSVTALSGTTRSGTNTLTEIRTMRRLGLEPRFSHRLTADSLLEYDLPALLHVDEPVLGGTARHAVALLKSDAGSRTVTIGNPLWGIRVLRVEELDGYWIGEAVLVQADRRTGG